jgi:hypothetical protein
MYLTPFHILISSNVPDTVSFLPVQRFDVAAPYLYIYCGTSKAIMFYKLLLKWIAGDILPYRPHRIEPRAVKRRPKEYALLNKPRQHMREAILK